MSRRIGIRSLAVLFIGICLLFAYSRAAGAQSLPAVTDNTVGPNTLNSTISLEYPGHVSESQATWNLSGVAQLEFDEETRTLVVDCIDLNSDAIAFSIPVPPWEVTGTIQFEFPGSYYSYYPLSAYVSPLNGFFTTFLPYWVVNYTLSAYVGGITIVEDYQGYLYLDLIGVSGTFVAGGDTDGDGLSEYELAFGGSLSFTMELGEIPLIGETAVTIDAEMDLGLRAEPLHPDSYEPDNSLDDGTPLSPDEVQSHSIHENGDVDWMVVTVLEEHEYEVQTSNVSGCNRYMELGIYDDTGSAIAYGWYGEPVSWTATYTGEYYVTASGAACFNYDISLRIAKTAFILLSPEDGALLSSPPIFGWTPEGYDLFFFALVYYDTDLLGYRNVVVPLLDDAYEIPSSWWDTIAMDYPCYWYVFGMGTVSGDEDIAGPKVFWKVPPCMDNDGDGYGDPASPECTYPTLDCDDSNPVVNAGAPEGTSATGTCSDGADNDCDGLTDRNDPDCPGGYAGVANAEASMYGRRALIASGSFNALALLLIPAGAVIVLKIVRRKR